MSKVTITSIGENIRKCRESHKLTQKELATLIGKKSSAYIALVENDKRQINIKDLKNISDVLGLSIEGLIGQFPYRGQLGTMEVSNAIQHDQLLTKKQKKILKDIYFQFIHSHD